MAIRFRPTLDATATSLDKFSGPFETAVRLAQGTSGVIVICYGADLPHKGAHTILHTVAVDEDGRTSPPLRLKHAS